MFRHFAYTAINLTKYALKGDKKSYLNHIGILRTSTHASFFNNRNPTYKGNQFATKLMFAVAIATVKSWKTSMVEFPNKIWWQRTKVRPFGEARNLQHFLHLLGIFAEFSPSLRTFQNEETKKRLQTFFASGLAHPPLAYITYMLHFRFEFLSFFFRGENKLIRALIGHSNIIFIWTYNYVSRLIRPSHNISSQFIWIVYYLPKGL